MEKIAIKNGEKLGRVVYETTLYIIKHDEDGETFAYAELEDWDVDEVKDMDSLHETIDIIKHKKRGK